MFIFGFYNNMIIYFLSLNIGERFKSENFKER